LILVLVALSLFLIGCDSLFDLDHIKAQPCPEGQIDVGGKCANRTPNWYTCSCECTKGFSVGADIQAATDVNVRQDPAGTVLGMAPGGSQGTIIDGPQQADLNGTSETWWKIHWDPATGLQDGWSVQSLLTVVGSDTLVHKDVAACLTPELNANVGGTFPTTQAPLDADCSTDRVAPHLAELTGQNLPPGAQCACAVTALPTMWADECDVPCTDSVCRVSGTDPEQVTAEPLSTALFATTSVCEVSGTATITVKGHEPKTQPHIRGLLQIHGRPCPAAGCQVGLAYQLTADDIEFDSGTIFADDPKFVDLGVSGATEPNAVALGPFLGFFIGDVRPGTALTSARGRRSGSSDSLVAVFRNTQSVALGVSWDGKACRLSGPLIGQITGDKDEGTLDLHVDVELTGVIVNQPPVANAGADQTVECTSPEGAPITLNGSGSADADNNIAFYTWRRGSDTGPLVGDPSPAPMRTTRQGLGQTSYVLRVVDGNFAADSASVNVNVVDRTAPVIDCHAPATLTPPDAPVSFRATATDTCGAPPPVVVDNVQCFHVKPNGGLEDPSLPCQVVTQGDTITIRNTGGVNGIIRWSAQATDGAGNVGQRTCEVSVVNPGSGR
jgi:hypothetical protein